MIFKADPLREKVRKFLYLRGVKKRYPTLEREYLDILSRIFGYTMTSPERQISLIDAVDYIVKAKIPGSLVEAGVWRGGSVMAMASRILQKSYPLRDIHLFDTFEGMPAPEEKDRDFKNRHADQLLAIPNDPEQVKCYSSIEEVRSNLRLCGYPESELHFIKGKVEDTVPAQAPASIALLRIDTDWHKSTYHLLQHLYERISEGGVLIIDDYGHWKGARSAVDEFFNERALTPLLFRIDYTARMILVNHGRS